LNNESWAGSSRKACGPVWRLGRATPVLAGLALSLAGCAGRPPPVPASPIAARVNVPDGWIYSNGGYHAPPQPTLAPPEYSNTPPPPVAVAVPRDSGVSLSHDLATGVLAVAGVEAGKRILPFGAKTGAAVTTAGGAAAVASLRAAPAAAEVVAPAAAAEAGVSGSVVGAAEAGAAGAVERAAAVDLGEMVLDGIIWVGEECILVFCR
jgi:hypothetical protein